MKISHFAGVLSAILCAVFVASCDKDKKGPQVTGYKEYTLTVASERVLGVVTSCGNTECDEVYAVKKEQSEEWEAFGPIDKFDYEAGYEYEIRVKETNYLDYDRGEPAWTEYELLEILSKVAKTSGNLPGNLIPDWYFEENCLYVDPEFAYGIDADNKKNVEDDLTSDPAYKFDGMDCYLTFATDKWFLLDADKRIQDYGFIIRKPKDPEDFPGSYDLLLQEYSVKGYGQFDFVEYSNPEDVVMRYDVVFYIQVAGKDILPEPVGMCMCKDLTAYYQRKFPEAGVKGVAVRYSIKF